MKQLAGIYGVKNYLHGRKYFKYTNECQKFNGEIKTLLLVSGFTSYMKYTI